MTKTRKILIGSVAAGALSLLLVWAIPAYAQQGGNPAPPPADDWQAMHNACSTGDWDQMNNAMQRVHGGSGGMMGGVVPGQGTQQAPRSAPGIQGIQGTQGTRAQYRSGYASDRSVGGGMMGGYGGGGMMGRYGQGGGGMMGGYGSGPGGMMGGIGQGLGNWIGGMMGGGGMMGW